MSEPKSKYLLPEWPQKANQLRRVRGLRRRLLRELQLLNELAIQTMVPTADRPAFQVLDDIEWVMEQAPSSSPSYSEYRHE